MYWYNNFLVQENKILMNKFYDVFRFLLSFLCYIDQKVLNFLFFLIFFICFSKLSIIYVQFLNKVNMFFYILYYYFIIFQHQVQIIYSLIILVVYRNDLFLGSLYIYFFYFIYLFLFQFQLN